MNAASEHPGTDFRTAFCAKYPCEPGQFEKAVLRRCFPLRMRLPGIILLAIRPREFQRELEMIGRLAPARSESQVRQELEGYAYEIRRDRPFRAGIGLRLSRRRFLRLMRRVMLTVQTGRSRPPVS